MEMRVYLCKRCGYKEEVKKIGYDSGCRRCRNTRAREREWSLRELTWEECFRFIECQLFRFKIQVSPEDIDLLKIDWAPTHDGYARKTIKNKPVYLHRVIVERMFGFRPRGKSGRVIDHIDRNKLNNKRENLRIVSFSENVMNRDWYVRSKNSYTEICETGEWRSRLRIGKVSYELGSFVKREDAHAAAIAKRKELGLSCEYRLKE